MLILISWLACIFASLPIFFEVEDQLDDDKLRITMR